jgi:succinate dehydrogenase / fumarate reductase, iron-sulfur subunit
MVELTLPKPVQPTQGASVHKAAPGATNVKTFKIYRYDPEVDANPRWDTFELPT